MGELSRIGIALDSDLLERFDHSIEKSGYTNRSEAFRDLIRDRLVREHTAAPDATVVGTVTLIFNHHAYGITEKLTEAQHEHHDLVVSTSHAHLDHDSCLEVLIVHGKAAPRSALRRHPHRPQRRAAWPPGHDRAHPFARRRRRTYP